MFGMSNAELHVRELARRSGLHEATVRQELRKLKRLDFVIDRRDGNRVYYRANREHPLYSEIHRVVLKTTGLVEVLLQALKGADIAIAFVFGSVAKDVELATSDVDLMVIGSLSLRKLTSLVSGVSEEVGRDINPHIMTANEYKKRIKKRDHFVTHVLDGPKLFIVGNEHDFEAMGK